MERRERKKKKSTFVKMPTFARTRPQSASERDNCHIWKWTNGSRRETWRDRRRERMKDNKSHLHAAEQQHDDGLKKNKQTDKENHRLTTF